MGANPFGAIDMIRKRLKIHAAAVQIPIGIDNNLKGSIDLVEMKSHIFEGDRGERIITSEIPENLRELS